MIIWPVDSNTLASKNATKPHVWSGFPDGGKRYTGVPDLCIRNVYWGRSEDLVVRAEKKLIIRIHVKNCTFHFHRDQCMVNLPTFSWFSWIMKLRVGPLEHSMISISDPWFQRLFTVLPSRGMAQMDFLFKTRVNPGRVWSVQFLFPA